MDYKDYRCLDPVTNKVFISRHVLFHEHKFPYRTLLGLEFDVPYISPMVLTFDWSPTNVTCVSPSPVKSTELNVSLPLVTPSHPPQAASGLAPHAMGHPQPSLTSPNKHRCCCFGPWFSKSSWASPSPSVGFATPNEYLPPDGSLSPPQTRATSSTGPSAPTSPSPSPHEFAAQSVGPYASAVGPLLLNVVPSSSMECVSPTSPMLSTSASFPQPTTNTFPSPPTSTSLIVSTPSQLSRSAPVVLNHHLMVTHLKDRVSKSKVFMNLIKLKLLSPNQLILNKLLTTHVGVKLCLMNIWL